MSTAPHPAGAIPAHLAALVDDAAIFPPGNAPLPVAVRAYREHRAAPYADLVGPFVISDVRLAELVELISTGSTTGSSPATASSPTTGEPLPVTVVVSGGAGAIEPAVRWATRSGVLALRSLEIAVRDDDSGALAHNAKRIVTAIDQLVANGELDDEVPVYVEPPRLYGEPPGHGWLAALDEIAAMDHRLKFRTGGADLDAFPAATELATVIDASLDRELRFKCTAGLHNALRHRDPETGFEHHGFLNVLVATAQALAGADVDGTAEILEQQDPAAVLSWVTDLSADGELTRARRWFTSFGSCSVLEPLEDLIDLRLLPDLPLEHA